MMQYFALDAAGPRCGMSSGRGHSGRQPRPVGNDEGDTAIRERFMRITAAHGVAMMLAGCLWGLLPRPAESQAGFSTTQAGGVTQPATGLIGSDRAMVSAHHQFAHQAEFTLALAFAWPLLSYTSPSLLTLLLALTLVGMWLNPVAYVVMAVSGQASPLAASYGKGMGHGPWSQVATVMFMVCGVCDVLALALWVWGLVRERPAGATRAAQLTAWSQGAAGETEGKEE